jgi:hypothetical protein
MNMYNAARAAGYSHNYATKACEHLEKNIPSLADELRQQGLTDRKLAEDVIALTQATKIIGYLHQYKKGENGRIEKASPDETVSNEFIDTPDWTNREKGLRLAMQILKLIDNGVKIDQSTHITYAYLRSATAIKERSNEATPLQTR